MPNSDNPAMCHHIFFLTIDNICVYFNQRSLAFLVLITGIVGGLLIVFSILLLCKYFLNRKNLRETEQMKLLYEKLNQASLLDSNRFYQCGYREFSRLEPRRSNPLDRYQLPETQWQIPSSKPVPSDYHTPGVQGVYNQPYHENREQNNKKQHDSHHVYGDIINDDEPAEQYLQVDPRCYVRQKSNASITTQRKSEVPRLEKGHSINVDTRPSPTSSSLSPYRQSSFDVTLANQPQNQQLFSTPSPAISTQQEIFFTPRGSNISVVGNNSTGTLPDSQHLSPPISLTSRQNSLAEKKDIAVILDASGQTPLTRLSIVQRERAYSRSLEHPTPSDNTTVDKQSRSFDAVHLLRPGVNRDDVIVNRRTKSYECAEDCPSPIAPPPIVIKIPDMRQLVQAAKLSQLQNKELNEYQKDSNLTNRKTINNHTNKGLTSEDLWRLRHAYEYEQQQQQLDGTSPDDLSPDLLTSTSIDSAGAMAIHQTSKIMNNVGNDEDPSKYEYRRKSSSNLLLPPPEVRRQALRRTFEKRRRCINQSNAKREEQLLNNQIGLDDDYDQNNQSSTMKSTDFLSLLNNFNSKSENSSFDRSLETDFDMQSDTSSREPNDHFTSIESSGNENALPDITQRLLIDRRRQQQQQQQSSHQDDSGYKSLESQNSQNHTFSLDWMSADGVESVIYMDESRRQQQRSVDLNDLEEDLNEEQILNNNQLNSNLYQSTILNLPFVSNSNMIEQRDLSTKTTKLAPSTSFIRTASKKRREFGKDKRHASSNTGLPHVITTDEQQYLSPTIHQINEITPKRTSSSTLQVRHLDFRRSKSDEGEILEPTSRSIESNKIPIQSSSNPNRLNNSDDSLLHNFQPLPSSTTSSVAISPQIIAFRSKRGSISFDNPTSTLNPIKLSPSVIKPRLKFSMVRNTTTSSLGSNTSNCSMTLPNDFSIDEKTNRIINEFLMQDNNNNNNDSSQDSLKRVHQPIRQKTFDETVMNNNQKQLRTALIKQRQHSFIQPNVNKQTSISYVADINTHNNKVKNNSESSSLKYNQQFRPIAREDNDLVINFPSIIVTGYESGS